MDQRELVEEIISVTAPVFIKKALKYARSGFLPTDDEIVKEVAIECEVTETTDGSIPAGPYGVLAGQLQLIIGDIISDLKAQIKQEIMMKIEVELAEVRSQLFNAKLEVTSTTKYGNSSAGSEPYGGLPSFDVTEELKIDNIASGYSSIEKFAPTANPLYNMVEKSLKRSEMGLSTHTAEDLNEARKLRSDADTEEKIRIAEEQFIKSTDEKVLAEINEGSTEVNNDDLWDTMFKQRYG